MPKGGHRPLCTFQGCREPNLAKGLCATHYRRWRSSGHPEGGRKVEVGRTLLDKATRKFLRGLRKLKSGCWTCDTAYVTRAGYLHIQITERGVQHAFKVHRFSYEHFVGRIPKGKLICHTCDVKSCCNPKHLFPGSQSDNMQDMVRKGRGLVGEKSAKTKFTEADILRIYRYVNQGLSRAAIAQKYNVAAVTISHIATGRNWKHLYERHGPRKPV
jgi:hypothetical protein